MSKADIAELKNQVQFLDLLEIHEHELYKERLKDLHKRLSRMTSKKKLPN